jgi:predicted small lipoprotein YifL
MTGKRWRPWSLWLATQAVAVLAAGVALAGCGGGGPLGLPDDVANPSATEGRHLSFAYFQRCVQPMLATPQPGPGGSNTCASAGCHDSATGTGGALRLAGAAAAEDLALAAEQIRGRDMHRNFLSAQGVTVIGNPDASLLLAKPRLLNVLHGGGLILDADSQAARRIAFWIARPMPPGQDEFSDAGLALLDTNGGCRTE